MLEGGDSPEYTQSFIKRTPMIDSSPERESLPKKVSKTSSKLDNSKVNKSNETRTNDKSNSLNKSQI